MAKINNIIGLSSMELIRERIKVILDTELAAQAAMCAAHDPIIPFDLPTVFTERYTAIDQQEASVIVVRLDDGVFSNKDQSDVTADYQFYIDCYSYSGHIGADAAYYLSSAKMQRLMALVRAILQDQSYRTLGFSKSIMNIKATNITKVKTGTRVDMPDSLAETCGRVTFSVEVAESVENKTGIPLATSNNTVILGNTGYLIQETT